MNATEAHVPFPLIARFVLALERGWVGGMSWPVDVCKLDAGDPRLRFAALMGGAEKLDEFRWPVIGVPLGETLLRSMPIGFTHAALHLVVMLYTLSAAH